MRNSDQNFCQSQQLKTQLQVDVGLKRCNQRRYSANLMQADAITSPLIVNTPTDIQSRLQLTNSKRVSISSQSCRKEKPKKPEGQSLFKKNATIEVEEERSPSSESVESESLRSSVGELPKFSGSMLHILR